VDELTLAPWIQRSTTLMLALSIIAARIQGKETMKAPLSGMERASPADVALLSSTQGLLVQT
jgi:hypothetical protein